jgi:ABC-type sulfate/molybdate transport systems ATPase subunit
VALARALCASPAVLLLDEPLAALDPSVRRDVRAALLEVRATSGAAMVFVTHDLEDALAVGTHLSMVCGSSLTLPALPHDVLQSPPSLEAARVLGVYSEIAGVVRDDAGGRAFEWIGGRVPATHASRGAAVACVRAHEIIVAHGADNTFPSLSVRARRDGAHDTMLTLASDTGATVTVRTSGGSAVAEGDKVQVSLSNARIFSTG